MFSPYTIIYFSFDLQGYLNSPTIHPSAAAVALPSTFRTHHGPRGKSLPASEFDHHNLPCYNLRAL